MSKKKTPKNFTEGISSNMLIRPPLQLKVGGAVLGFK